MSPRPNKYAKISIEDRDQLINRIQNNHEHLSTVRKDLKIAKSTSYNIIKKFRHNHQVAPKPRGGTSSYKLLKEHLIFIQNTIRNYKNQKIKITLALLKSELELHFPGFRISSMTISRHIKSNTDLTLKQPITLSPPSPFFVNNPNDSNRYPSSWENKLSHDGVNYLTNCVFVDEAGCNIVTEQQHYQRYSFMAAMSSSGPLHIAGKYGYITSKNFASFCEKLFPVLQKKNPSAKFIVMDRASIHTTDIIKNIFSRSPYILYFLPNHSPLYNPVEYLMLQSKKYIKSRPSSLNNCGVDVLLEESIQDITPECCQTYIRHSKMYFTQT